MRPAQFVIALVDLGLCEFAWGNVFQNDERMLCVSCLTNLVKHTYTNTSQGFNKQLWKSSLTGVITIIDHRAAFVSGKSIRRGFFC